MISRRSIRIKVFQTVYESIQQTDVSSYAESHNLLLKKLEESSILFTAITQLIVQISQYVLVYANMKASKHLPTKEDLIVNTDMATCTLIEKIRNNKSFIEAVKKYKLANAIDIDEIRTIFLELIEKDIYKKFTANPTAENAEIELISELFNTCIIEDEHIAGLLEDKFMQYDVDAEMMSQWMDKLLKHPSSFNYTTYITPEKKEFAEELLETYFDKRDIVFKVIEPKLKNWDADRVANIDLILLHLAVCELMYFPNIPVKVTINEYIDLAKAYSTPQSGQFVNGVVDSVRKMLEVENKIRKIDFVKK
jgi:N utilization substance protein B